VLTREQRLGGRPSAEQLDASGALQSVTMRRHAMPVGLASSPHGSHWIGGGNWLLAVAA
jgi:hypothetical protein